MIRLHVVYFKLYRTDTKSFLSVVTMHCTKKVYVAIRLSKNDLITSWMHLLQLLDQLNGLSSGFVSMVAYNTVYIQEKKTAATN